MECFSKIYGWQWANKKTRSGKEWEMIWAKWAKGRNASTQSGARSWSRDFFNYQRDILMWRLHKIQIFEPIPLVCIWYWLCNPSHCSLLCPTVQTSYLKVPRENKSLVCPKVSFLPACLPLTKQRIRQLGRSFSWSLSCFPSLTFLNCLYRLHRPTEILSNPAVKLG